MHILSSCEQDDKRKNFIVGLAIISLYMSLNADYMLILIAWQPSFCSLKIMLNQVGGDTP